MKKKIDERIRILIENCVKLNQRGLILLIGDRSIYQVSLSITLSLITHLILGNKFNFNYRL